MKASRKTLFALVGAMAMGAAMAAPSVEIVSVQQQYPWTNTVDIVYQVEGVTNMDYFVKFTPTTSAGAGIPDVNGQYDIQVALTNSGTYTAQWYPQTNQQYTACRMTPSVFRGAAKDYMIVDLETGAVTYEPMATQEASNQRYNTDEYKTKKIVFRRVPAGTYDVTDGTAKAVMDKDYYLSIFAVTIAQYNQIMGLTESSDKHPKNLISWNSLRDSALSAARVPDTGNGALAKLNAKVHSLGNSSLYFDLPNEAMWEVACRAGCPADWQRWWGTTNMTDSTGMTDNAWWSGNSNVNGIQEVGLKPANPWGFFDILGNIWTWCRDSIERESESATKNWPISLTQAPLTTGTAGAARGGRAGDVVTWVRCSSCIRVYYKSTGYQIIGFRIALIVE